MFNELFQKKGLTMERLRRFIEASQHNSYAEAAEYDPSVASQFSRDISALETYFECELVTKTGRQISGLTPQGERLRHLVTEYFGALIALQEEFRDPPELIRIGGGETVLQWVVCTRLLQLKAAFPNSRLSLSNLSSRDVVKQVEAGRLDVGVVDTGSLVQGGEIPAHFAILPLGEIEYALYLTESLLEQHRGLAESQLLENLPLAGLEGLPPLATAHQFEQARAGYNLNFAVILTSFPQVIQAVRTGSLAGFLPTLAEAELQQHGIVRVDSALLSGLKVKIALIYNLRLEGVKPYLATLGSTIHTILRGDAA